MQFDWNFAKGHSEKKELQLDAQTMMVHVPAVVTESTAA
jgi:hypothetical protein